MRKAFYILVVLNLLWGVSSSGQKCPERDSLYGRLNFLMRNPKIVLPAEQLKELLNYEKAIRFCSYRNDSLHALLLQGIGNAYYKQSDFILAISYFRNAIDLINTNAIKPSVKRSHLVKIYYRLSVLYDSLHRVSEKMAAIDSCVDIAYQTKSINLYYQYTLYTLNQRVKYLLDVGDYERCVQYARLGENITKQYMHGVDSMSYIIRFFTWNVSALFILKDYGLAEKLLYNKEQEFKKAMPKDLATLYGLMAQLEINKANFKKAILHTERALYFAGKSKADKTHGQMVSIEILTNLGYYIYDKHYNDATKAINTYKKALAIINKNKSADISFSFEAMNILSNVANIFLKKKRYDSAFIYYQLAFDQISPGMNEKILLASLDSFLAYEKIGYLTALVVDKGDAFLKQFYDTHNQKLLQMAISVYKSADLLLSRINAEHFELQSKLFWRSDSRRLYEHAIDACYQNHNSADAFYFFEKSRAMLLNEQLNQQHLLVEEDILQIGQLKKKILQKEKELARTLNTSSLYQQLQDDVIIHSQQLDRLQKLIKERNPLYYQSFIDINFITLKDVKKKILNSHQAMLELFSGDSAVYALIITDAQTYLKKINKAEFDSAASRYTKFISDPEALNMNFDVYLSSAQNLYKLIFQRTILPPGRIVISPDGRYFPYESLVTNSGKKPVYFLADHSVTYTYSAKYLLSDFNATSAAASGNFLGMAPVNYGEKLNLPSLHGSDISLQKVRSYFNQAKILTGGEASKVNFLKIFSKYKVIQFYTHGTEKGISGEPVIYFADSALNLSDLIAGNIPVTSLIVLSACESGNGRFYEGEGVFSFNRGFASIGIPASVSNLWAVENKSTYLLTELFYKHLANGLPADVALQKAKLEFIRTTADGRDMPYYWAAPILVGKIDSISFKKSDKWAWIFLLLPVIGLSMFVLQKTSRKK